jgi:hypothetical protein
MPTAPLQPRRWVDSKPPICRPSPRPPPGYCAGVLLPPTQATKIPGTATGTFTLAYTDHPPTGPARVVWQPDVGHITAPEWMMDGQQTTWVWDAWGAWGTHQLTVLYQLQGHPTCIYTCTANFIPPPY